MPVLRYEAGTLTLEGQPPDDLPPGFVWDARVGRARAPAYLYSRALEHFWKQKISVVDEAKKYNKLERKHLSSRTARDYQEAAIQT